jgi:hypothetical protein
MFVIAKSEFIKKYHSNCCTLSLWFAASVWAFVFLFPFFLGNFEKCIFLPVTFSRPMEDESTGETGAFLQVREFNGSHDPRRRDRQHPKTIRHPKRLPKNHRGHLNPQASRNRGTPIPLTQTRALLRSTSITTTPKTNP